jgi:transcriptional regulator with XRE-family HTH domain
MPRNTEKYVRKKPPQSIDIGVGQRVRMRRMMLGISQEKLAEALGLSFQQVQKYEKGGNRIGAGRLQQIAAILQVPVSFFFDEAEAPTGDSELRSEMKALFTTRDGLDLASAFQKIKDPKLQRSVVALVEQMAGE